MTRRRTVIVIVTIAVIIVVLAAAIGFLWVAQPDYCGGGNCVTTKMSTAAPEAYLYVTAKSDAGRPIPGVQVSGTIHNQTLFGTGEPETIGAFRTNSTGSVFIAPDTGELVLSMQYQSKSYFASAHIASGESTYVTLGIPSGNITVNCIPWPSETRAVCP